MCAWKSTHIVSSVCTASSGEDTIVAYVCVRLRLRIHVCVYNNSSESVHTCTPTSHACSTFRFGDTQLALTCTYVRTYGTTVAVLYFARSLAATQRFTKKRAQTDRQAKQAAGNSTTKNL